MFSDRSRLVSCPPALIFIVALLLLPVASADAGTAVKIATSPFHQCLITTGGGVRCWGDNTYGQLGDGTITDRSNPVDVPGLGSAAVDIATGAAFTCALLDTGRVKCWGANGSGQLGDGSTEQWRPTAGDVPGLTDVVRLSALQSHICAVTRAGAARCWGRNWYGQLGDGSTTSRSTPVDVVGLAANVLEVHAGESHTCAVLATGAVKCWGGNTGGQLGDGTTTMRLTPVDVIGMASGTVHVVAARDHSCSVTETGGVKCWGLNGSGQLGDGTMQPRPGPVDVINLTSAVTDLDASFTRTCALTVSSDVMCWGSGWLGDGRNVDAGPTPVKAVDLPRRISALSSGGETCVVTASGHVKCWDFASPGIDRKPAGDVFGLVEGVTQVVGGAGPMSAHTCAVTQAGGAKCWGANAEGQLGDGSTVNRGVPVDVLGLTSGVASLAAGRAHTCALTVAGGVKCWGRNAFGQLGDGSTTSHLEPVDVVGLASGVTAISTSGQTTCALLAGGGVKCWGYNEAGQVGDGTVLTRTVPVDVIGLSGVAAIAVTDNFTCALTNTGAVKRWGGDTHTPTTIPALASGVVGLAAGPFHACVITSAGGAKCWGVNLNGELGSGRKDYNFVTVPVDVVGLTSGVLALAAGGQHTCALISGGAVKCWGDSYAGQNSLVPVGVPGVAGAATGIGAGLDQACAITAGGRLQCWGVNNCGQLGDSTYVQAGSATPLPGYGPSADFNQDGKPDLVWRNRVTGDIIFWLMNGTTLGQEVHLVGPSDRNWKIVAIADFNRDGNPIFCGATRSPGRTWSGT